jgi:hypothetical protein
MTNVVTSLVSAALNTAVGRNLCCVNDWLGPYVKLQCVSYKKYIFCLTVKGIKLNFFTTYYFII